MDCQVRLSSAEESETGEATRSTCGKGAVWFSLTLKPTGRQVAARVPPANNSMKADQRIFFFC